MKKRILISFLVAVFFLEVGFGVYVAFERKYESALSSLVLPIDSVQPILIDTDREVEIASLLPEEALVDDTRAVVTARKAVARPVKGKSADTKLASTPLVSSRPLEKRARLRAIAEPGTQAVAARTTEVREVPAAELNAQKEPVRTDNKSFIAKTGTILKKPFGWIKAIGSKLR